MDLADLLGPTTGVGSIVETITTIATAVGPYLLGLFGALTVFSVGVALLGRAKKGIVAAVR